MLSRSLRLPGVYAYLESTLTFLNSSLFL